MLTRFTTIARNAMVPSSTNVGHVQMRPGLCLVICFRAGTKQTERARMMAWMSMATTCTHSHNSEHHDAPIAVLHCTALHCAALHCTALCCTALFCTALRYTSLHCTTLQDDMTQHLDYAMLLSTSPRCAKLCGICYAVLACAMLCCAMLCYTMLCCAMPSHAMLQHAMPRPIMQFQLLTISGLFKARLCSAACLRLTVMLFLVGHSYYSTANSTSCQLARLCMSLCWMPCREGCTTKVEMLEQLSPEGLPVRSHPHSRQQRQQGM